MSAEAVQQAYIETLGRAPDAAGRTFWVTQMENGMPIEQVRQLMASSPEGQRHAQEQITTFYRDYLGRTPDEAGLAFYMNELLQGGSLTDIGARIQGSAEAQKYTAGNPNPAGGAQQDTTYSDDEAWVRDPTGGGRGSTAPPLPPGWSDGGTTGPGVDDEEQQAAADAAAAAAEEAAAQEAAQSAAASIRALFPFISDMGLDSEIIEWARKYGANPDAILGEIRQTRQWIEMFPNIRRDDGTLRMNEGDYQRTMDSYREVLRGYGMYDERYDSNDELSGFMADGVEIDPSELEERLEIYSSVDRNEDVRAAFYIYAGMRVGTDDLYQAIVDPRYRDELANEYNARATMTNLDYDTWLTRSTEVALASLSRKLTEMEQIGAESGNFIDTLQFTPDGETPGPGGMVSGTGPGDVSQAALARIRSMDPNIAKEFMQVLHQGTQEGGEFLEDEALRIAFEQALLGSAAIAQGLGLPGADRIEEIRAAGVSRAAALQGYGEYAKDRNLYRSMARRAGFEGFSQSDFEQSSFLSDPGAMRKFEKAQGLEDSLGRATQGGAFSTSGGRFRQIGLRA